MDTKNLEVNERTQAIRTQLSQTIERMRRVLEADLRAFPSREGKRCFVEAGDDAQHMDDESLRSLKDELAELASVHVDSIMARLQDDNQWLNIDQEIPDPVPKTLVLNSTIMTILEDIARQTRAVLQAKDLPDDVLDFSYKTPTWFIDHEYMPGLIEQYWELLVALREANREARTEQADQDTQDRTKRWDEI